MKSLITLLIATLTLIPIVHGAPASTVPISQMPVTTNVLDNAYFPLIQPYPGRATNDNFRATTANIFTGRGTGTFTNIYVTNLFVTNVIMLGGTNVASVNPTIGRIPYKDTTNTFGDSALYFIDTNTVGTVELDAETVGVTNLVAGGLVASVDTGLGYGVLTNIPFSNIALWTNITGSVQTTVGNEVRVTNLYSAQTLNASGGFRTLSNSVEFLVAGTNVINPFGKAFIYLVSTVTNGAIVQLTSGDGPGSHVWLINVFTNSTFTLPAGELSGSPGSKVLIRSGAWTPTEEGEVLKLVGTPTGFSEEDRSNPNGPAPALGTNYWTNILGVLQPVDLAIQNMVNNGWYIGTNSPGFYGPLSGDSLVTFHNTALGDPNYANIQQIVSDSAGTSGNYSLFTINQDTGYTAFRLDTAIGSTNTARFALGSTTASGTNRAQLELFLPARGDPSLIMTRLDPEGFFGGVPYLFDTPDTASTNLANYLNNGTNQISIGPLAQIGFGEGGTNVMFRHVNGIIITNNSSGANVDGLQIWTGDGSSNLLTSAGNLAILKGVGGVGLFDSFSGGNEVRWAGGKLDPSQANSIIGGNGENSSIPWGIVNQRTNFVQGYFPSVTTNYSRGYFYHGGTNDSFHIGSEAGGIAGVAKPIHFDLDGTNILSLSTTIMDYDPVGTFNSQIRAHSQGNTALSTMRGAISTVELYSTGLGTGVSLQSYGTLLENFQAATSATPQNSPGLTWVGQGWSTNSAASQNVVFTAYAAPVSGNLTPGGQLELQGYYNTSGGLTPMAAFDLDTTSGDTRLLLWDVAAGTLVRVSRGAADSGGAGFRVLRVPN